MSRSRDLATDQGVITFEAAADAYIAAHESGWKNAKHASQWRNTLAADAYPVAGRLSVSDIDTDVVMRILKPIWGLKPETAGRLRGRIERVLDWATVSGFRQGKIRPNGEGISSTFSQLNTEYTVLSTTRLCPIRK